MIRSSMWVGLAAAALLLSGCASKEPMDYLPDCMAYFSMNPGQIRQQAGGKRALEAMEKIDPSPQSSSKLQHMYMGISGVTSGRPNLYAVMIGLPGFSESTFSDMKGKGGTETKVNGKKAMSIKGATFLALTDSAMLFSPDQANFETMFQVAKKKSPSAMDSPVFRKLKELEGAHGVTVAVNASQIISLASGQLGMLAALNPKGVEALKQVQTATLVADWEQAPKVELTLLLESEEGRKALTDLANFGLEQAKTQMARAGSGVPPAIADMIKALQVKTESEGVKLTVEFPKELADGALDELDKLVANMPADPKQREQAFQQAVMGLMTRNRGGAGAQRSPAGAPQAVAPEAVQSAPAPVGTPVAAPAAPAIPAAPAAPATR